MKKRMIISVILCVSVAMLAACASPDQTAGSAAPSASAAQASPSPSVEAQPTRQSSASAKASVPDAETGAAASAIDTGNMVFIEAYDEYFGGDAKAAVEKMAPMLLSAAQAAYAAEDMMFGTPDAISQWAVIYQYLNTYGDTDYERQEDGTLIVGEEDMLLLFRSFFGAGAVLPELQTDYNISYDVSAKQYLIGRSDFGDVSFGMTDLAFSDPTAFIALTADSVDGAAFDVLVQVTPDADSQFGYSILQVTQYCADT